MSDSRSPSASPDPRSPRQSSFHDNDNLHDDGQSSGGLDPDDVPVEILVKHLLAAKQSLSSMQLVLQGNDLATQARQMHEESVILSARASFMRHGIAEQVRTLKQVRRGMARTYDAGRRDFKNIIRTLDDANAELEQTMEMLRDKVVEKVFRPPGEEQKSLLDFVDENSVKALQDALKQSIVELQVRIWAHPSRCWYFFWLMKCLNQAAQNSFDGDLLRYDNDLRAINKAIAASAPPASPSASSNSPPMSHLLDSLTNHSHAMAEHLTSLTRHFDLCVTAVRTTEGGAALARRRAAEVTEGGDPVSISGVIAGDPESHMTTELEPIDPQERTEIVQVVVQDAAEVDDVVADIQGVLQQMETDFAALKEQTDGARNSHDNIINAFLVLEDVGSRLHSYIAAESEFLQRWDNEKDIIFGKLDDMKQLKAFYEGYANAYDSLLLEAARRQSVEDKIQATWRKAKEAVDKLVEADRRERTIFRQEIGEFLPTDLWVGMNDPMKMWQLVPVPAEGDASAAQNAETRQRRSSTDTLRKTP